MRPNASIAVGPDYISEAPDFAKATAGVIAFWAHNDGNLAAILSFMLKTDIRTAVAMYQAITSAEGKRAALLAAADNAREEWEAILLRAVLKANSGSRNQRNEFAHGIWGHSTDIPDAILLMDTRVVMDKNVSHRQAEEDGNGQRIIAPKGFDASKIMVYRQKDFDQALADAEASYIRLVYYYYLAGFRDERARKGLLNDPLVSQAAQKLCLDKTPEVQALLRPLAEGELPPPGYTRNPVVPLPD